MDLLQAVNAPEPVALAGRVFQARQLKLYEWAQLHGWLRSAAPGPVALAVAGLAEAARIGAPVPEDLRDAVLAEARQAARAWPPRVGTRAWLDALDSTDDGLARFVQAALRAGDPSQDLPLAECQDLAERATEREIAELLRVAYFGDPPDPNRQPPAPATPGATTTATTGAGPTAAGAPCSTS